MNTVRVQDVLKDPILVSRESAHRLEDAIAGALKTTAADVAHSEPTWGPVTVDFDGVQGIAPSFLDELLTVLEDLIAARTDSSRRTFVIRNPPTRLSLKFAAIARSHRLQAQELSDGAWELTEPPEAGR